MGSNKVFIASLYTALADGDVDTVTASLDPDVVWRVADGHPHGGSYNGIGDVVSGVQIPTMTEWEGFAATPETLIDAGDDTVIGIGVYTGTSKSTGKTLAARFAHVWKLDGGKVVAFESISDTGTYRDALS